MVEGEEARQKVLVCQVGRPVIGGEDLKVGLGRGCGGSSA